MDKELLQKSAQAANINEEAVVDAINTKLQTVGIPVNGHTFEGWIMYQHESSYSADGIFRTWAAPESDTSVSLSDEMAKIISEPTELGDEKAWAILQIVPAKPKNGRPPRFPYYVNLRLRFQRPRKPAKSIKEAMKLAEGVQGVDRRIAANVMAVAASAQKAIGE